MELIRENEENANLDKLNMQIKYLKNAIKLGNESKEFTNIIQKILEFQDKDGSFKMLNTYQVESDVRQDFCHYPTYLCTALLIKSYIYNKESVDLEKLNMALANCCHKDFFGHGYDGLDFQLKIMRLFNKCGVKEFLNYSCNQRFNEMIISIIDSYKEKIKNENYSFGFGNYEKEIKEVVKLYE